MKISFNRHKLLQWLERELCTILAFLVLVGGLVWAAQARTTIDVATSISILPAPGTLQLNVPNGGESWKIGTSHNIEWVAGAGITDVKLELQRTTGGAWETIVASVAVIPASYPWVVTGAVTTTAIVKISDATNPAIMDVSNGVFAITDAMVPPVISTPGGGGNGTFVFYPTLLNVTPSSFVNTTEVILDVFGSNFEYDTVFKLGDSNLRMLWTGNHSHVRLKVSKGFRPGEYILAVYNSNGTLATWDKKIKVEGLYYAAKLINQSESRVQLKAGRDVEVWVKLLNTGTTEWRTYGRNTTRLGTSQPRDRKSVFWRSSWILRNRPANVQKPGLKGKQVISPGEIGRFVFKVRAPQKAGTYVEYFQPVAEYLQWMDGTVSWEFVVLPKPVSTSTVQKSTGGKTGSIFTMPNLPAGPAEFYDQTERFLRNLGGLFNQLLGKFKGLWSR